MNYLGDFAEDDTVRAMFTTNDRQGSAVAPSSAFEAADLLIYKDNGVGQKATTNGITMTSPFDSVTGLHAVDIDTSVDTGDSGFWTTGSDYKVILSPDETIDGRTVVAIVGEFSIQNRYMRGTDSAYTGTPPSVSDILTTQMTESYAANGVAPTLAQAQFALHQMLMQFAISGTTYTVKKLNNSTTAFVVTLDDATTPTSAVRT